MTSKVAKVSVTEDTNKCAGLNDSTASGSGRPSFKLTLSSGGKTGTTVFSDAADQIFRVSRSKLPVDGGLNAQCLAHDRSGTAPGFVSCRPGWLEWAVFCTAPTAARRRGGSQRRPAPAVAAGRWPARWVLEVVASDPLGLAGGSRRVPFAEQPERAPMRVEPHFPSGQAHRVQASGPRPA